MRIEGQINHQNNIFPAFVLGVPAEAGLDPLVYVTSKDGGRIDGQVYAGMRLRDDGYLLILIEVADRSHRLAVSVNAIRLGISGQWRVSDCFGDQKGTISAEKPRGFETTLKAAEMKVFDHVKTGN